MSGNLYYTPGQTATFYKEVLNSNQQLVDDGYVPVVTRIIDPTLTALSGYPQAMTRIDTGVYVFQFIVPAVIGTYFVDIIYLNPDTHLLVSDSRQIMIFSPFGKFGLSSVGRAC